MLPNAHKPSLDSLLRPYKVFSDRRALRCSLPIMSFRFLRFLVIALVVTAILLAPFQYVAAFGSNPSHHWANHRPCKQRIPTVVKARVALAASTRSSSRNNLESKSLATKSIPSLISSSPTGHSLAFANLRRVFRPLRC